MSDNKNREIGGLIDFERGRDGFTTLTLRSERVEKLFKVWSNGKTTPIRDECSADMINSYGLNPQQLIYQVPNSLTLGGRRLDTLQQGLMLGKTFNAKWLALVGLRTGIQFKLCVPMSRHMINDLSISARAMVEELLVEYAKPAKVTQVLEINEDGMPTVLP